MLADSVASGALIGMIRARRWAMPCSFAIGDLAAIAAAGSLAVFVRYELHGHYEPLFYARLFPLVLLFIFTFTMTGLYPAVVLNPVEEIRRVSKSVTITYLILGAVSFLLHDSDIFSRLAFLMAWVLSIIFVLTARAVVRRVCSNRSWWGIAAVVLGGETAPDVAGALRRHRQLGLKVVARLDDRLHSDSQAILDDGIVVGPVEMTTAVVKQIRPSCAVLVICDFAGVSLSRILERYGTNFEQIIVFPELAGMSSLAVDAQDLGGRLGLRITQNLLKRGPQIIKRISDIVLGILIGLGSLPLVLIIVSAIRLGSRGPAFYGQQRIGRSGKSFVAWKFRTMSANADANLAIYLLSNPAFQEEWRKDFKLRRDPRVTPFGRFLRKTSLDELPQIWNVIRGEMSVVGPRPIVVEEIAKYGSAFDLYGRVRPGITGLWQVSGRNNTTYSDRVRLDEYYVKNWSLWLDVHVLCKTLPAVWSANGAY
jgi:Undecaprenyl-phosphate galactose phosphotransferase WbaP